MKNTKKRPMWELASRMGCVSRPTASWAWCMMSLHSSTDAICGHRVLERVWGVDALGQRVQALGRMTSRLTAAWMPLKVPPSTPSTRSQAQPGHTRSHQVTPGHTRSTAQEQPCAATSSINCTYGHNANQCAATFAPCTKASKGGRRTAHGAFCCSAFCPRHRVGAPREPWTAESTEGAGAAADGPRAPVLSWWQVQPYWRAGRGLCRRGPGTAPMAP